MRRLVLLCALVAVLAGAAPAAAQQRDPFIPLISPAEAATEPGETAPGATTDTEPAAEPRAPGTMPTTGAGVAPWLVLAYVLLAAGGGALLVARFASAPAYHRRRARG